MTSTDSRYLGLSGEDCRFFFTTHDTCQELYKFDSHRQIIWAKIKPVYDIVLFEKANVLDGTRIQF